jgi:protein required for attachment to host cells
MQIPRHAHVLVADGRKLLLFQNLGDEIRARLTLTKHLEQEAVATHDQGADRPGQTQSRVGGVRSGYEQTDFHRQDEDRFAADAAAMVRREILAGRIQSLIIVAAPRILGQLHKRFDDQVKRRVLAEIPKEVAEHTTEDIARLIASS